MKSEKNKKLKLVKISLIIFIIAITINIGYYLLFKSDTNGGAAIVWAVGIFPLSILLITVSVVLLIISLTYKNNDTKNNVKNSKKTIETSKIDLKYIDSEIGKEKLSKERRKILINLSIFILLCIILSFLSTAIAIIYIIIYSIIILIKEKRRDRTILKTLTEEICIDGFINLHIHNAKKAERKLYNTKFYKSYNYSLLNIVDGYIRKGEFEQANNIINFLEKRKLNNTSKAFLIRYKASIAFNNNNIEEFNKQYKNFNELSNTITEKIKNQILVSLYLQKYILENNQEQAIKICEQLLNNKILLNRIMGYYYKGLILEKNNNEEYKKYYRFVVENGNDLNIAKIASKKIKM